MKVHSRFSPPPKVVAPKCTEPGADQSFKKEADINVIMARYVRTGMLPNSGKEPYFADVTMAPSDLMQAQEILIKSKTAFEKLPSMLRDMFQNSPLALLEWLEDPENGPEAVKWGLLPEPQVRMEEPGQGEIVKDFTHQSAQ